MNPRRWFSTVRGWLSRRKSSSASPAEFEAIQRKLRGEPPVEHASPKKWPGIEARKQLSTFDFVMYIRTHKEMRPHSSDRASVRMIYEARLELLQDPNATPQQKIEAMSGTSRYVAEGAFDAKNMEGFRVVVDKQIKHMQDRIKEFS